MLFNDSTASFMSDNFASTRNTISNHKMRNNTSFNDLTMKEVNGLFGSLKKERE